VAFNSENAVFYQALGTAVKQAKKPKSFDYAVELQGLLMNDARKEDLTASARSQVARAFVELEELKLRLKMKPAPKPIDVSNGLRRKRSTTGANGFSEAAAVDRKPG
jgi:hypothetical protein